MEPVAISWLVASSASPLVAVLALWTIYVFHTYRRRWRTVDLFLLAATSQELIVSVFTFCYAIVSLINPPFRAPCNFVQWGLVSTRTFQMATLASMVADRSLTVRWPYRYRFSVRRNQIRYHVAVLALVSVLVGVAAVFARSPHHHLHHHSVKSCLMHPVQWDVKYTVFVEALYAVLVLVTLGCAVQIEVHRRRHRTLKGGGGSFQLPECVSPELPSANGMSSPLDTQSSTGSTRALHRPCRQASRRPYGRHSKGASDLRWAPVGLAALLCFAINHVPYMVWTGVVAWRPALWSPWLEAALSWLRLLEGLLLPLLLFARDRPLRAALGRAFQRRSGTLSPLVGEDGPFQMYFDKDHFRKRGTFGAVAPVGIITNYRRAPGSGKRQRSGGGRYALPGLRGADSVLGGGGGEPLSKLSCADLTSLGMWREEEEEEEENFYATLSDDFSTFSCRSADDSALSEDVRVNEELYGGSFTTLANDDFEFHDTRPCGGEVRMRPALDPPPPTYPSSNLSFRDHLQQKADKSSHIPFDKSRDLFDFVDQSDEDRKDPRIFMMPLPPPPSDPPKEEVANESLAKETNKFGTMSRHQKATSYSMNDLDLIHSGLNARPDEEATFVLPVKSESTMSLYRLNMDRDLDQLLLSPSRSETNVHSGIGHNGDDSGFGSGVRSTASPVWSGFLCRKPSDPFWNMRRPPCEGVLHPRMRKIPWITAWKKLGESSRQSQRCHQAGACVQQDLCGWSESSRPVELDQSKQCNGGIYGWSECGGSRPVEHDQLQQSSRVYGWSECGGRSSQQQACGWKDNVVYGDNKNGILMRGKIDEELSDISTPVSPGDYNLDIFAKESGVLLENAYGKIVRDHCGVQVNFYGSRENPLYQGNDGFSSAAPEADREMKRGKIYQPVNEFHKNVPESSSKEVMYNARAQAVENLFCGGAGNANDNDIFRCELRLNGGHYENLFGTKENIFAQCDQYFDRSSKQKGTNLLSQLEMRESGNVAPHRDSGRFKHANNNNLLSNEAATIYGQLRMVERKDSVNRGNENVKTKEINCNLLRNDSKSNKCGIKRKESKNKDDRNGKGVVRRESKERKKNVETNINSDDIYKNKIEIRLQEDGARNDLSRRDSQSRNARPEVRNNLSPLRRNSSERQRNVNIEQNRNLQVEYLQDEVSIEKKPIRLERKKSQNRKQLEEEIANREDRNVEAYPRKHHQDNNRIIARVQNEGLWVNAEPFVIENLNERYEGSKDKLQRESRKDIHDLQSGAREQDLHGKQVDLVRKESKTKADRPKHPIRRKSSATRGRRYHSEPSEGAARIKEAPTRGIKRKESMGRKDKPEDNARWSQSIENELRPEEIENFVKYRDKCEGNFSHIQNLNRETSTERESCRLENLIYGGKSNAEIFPFETFQEPKQRVHPFAHRTVLDVNDNNCRQKKLAITDFL